MCRPGVPVACEQTSLAQEQCEGIDQKHQQPTEGGEEPPGNAVRSPFHA